MLPLVFQTSVLEYRDQTPFDGILPDAPCGVGAGKDADRLQCRHSSAAKGSIYAKYVTLKLVGNIQYSLYKVDVYWISKESLCTNSYVQSWTYSSINPCYLVMSTSMLGVIDVSFAQKYFKESLDEGHKCNDCIRMFL